MARPSRERRISRRSWLLAGLTVPLFRARAADSMKVSFDGDNLHVAAPALHFLSGKPLERLKDGDVVAYVTQLELLDESRSLLLRQVKGRFVVSYALWEEKFSVTLLGSTPGSSSRGAEGLSAAGAEAWCVESLALSATGLSPNAYYWMRFQLRTGTQRDLTDDDRQGLSVTRLVELFGRKNTEITQWGPLEARVRLADLPRPAGRGPRNG
jgi:hypothetical protein